MENKISKIKRENADWLFNQGVNVQLEILNHHLDVCKVVINTILDQDVERMAGPRYKHDPENRRYNRWGSNPGSVKIGDQKFPVQVPRVYDKQEDKNVSLETYEKLKELPKQNDQVVQAVLHGLSMRDYGRVVDKFFDSFGLSSSSISRDFVARSKEAIEEFEKRRFEDMEFVAMFIDGKHLASQQMVIALGVTSSGRKMVLGVIQTTSENSTAIKQLFKDMVDRGLKFEDGLLFIVDGAKGIKKAIEETFGEFSVIQRCQWHKRENVVKNLNRSQQDHYRKKLQSAYNQTTYEEAKEKLILIHEELLEINRTSANSLLEGLEETLTIHRLGLYDHFSKSFTTTNCIESLNSQLDKYTSKVKRWMNSDQRYRWVICGLQQIEVKLRRVDSYYKLHLMQQAIKENINEMKNNPKESY